jgi:hypothetical protein
MTFARSQKGMSMLGWVVVFGLAAFFASAGFKMLPHYMDFWSIEKSIMSLETDSAVGVKTVSDFHRHVKKGMQVNGVRGLDLDEAMSVQLEGNEFFVHLNYEKREPLIQNLDLVVTFDKEFRIRAQ